MTVANMHDQAVRYNNMRQGDKEYVSDFEIRFDQQVLSNKKAGMSDISERLRAMDFIGKFEFKRYNGMLTSMRNCACQNLQGSYPKTLSTRTASTWTREGLLVPLGSDSHSAFLADTAFILTKGKDSTWKPAGERRKYCRLRLQTKIVTAAGKRGISEETAVSEKGLYPTLLSWFRSSIQMMMSKISS
jgi:hypothetical protein